ncbi:uncharacterized protein STEHIDRAFT_134780 [Stereum hirsutum FP-91666 SS1]|uniref:uncharacterized protein n=1 Tax=Stereum hirsutum (strain FP-91666) TaxID=721885 RepID=UPI0004449B79|nr:uncharacterized protein STEHIDRAFT_134780 [Stereum hirsutum FP-91666 SS1]EIM81131.1 hypothetical protein STEHIDRAFT_134780 [Stereum hirsutum FP-91666 SS1]
MTLAPRVEVYTQLACRAIHGNDPVNPNATSLYFSPSYEYDGYNTTKTHDEDYDYDYTTISLPSRGIVDADALDACKGDPRVQGRAARIQASVKTTESILSAATTGWLSHLSDVYGRKKVLAFSVFGALFMDIIYIMVLEAKYAFAEHGEAFIIIAPVIEGFLGAQSTYNGLVHAYATDCTPNGSRARIFSTMQGMLYVGLASGPWLNGLILHLGSGSTTRTLFVAAIIIALINLSFVSFVLPESLPPSSRLKEGSRDSRSESVSSGMTSESASTRSSIHHGHRRGHGGRGGRGRRRRSVVGAVKGLAKYVARQFWRPVRLFLPHWVEAGNGKKGRWDWNLTLVGITLFIYLLSIQVYNLKYLYVRHVYNWSSETLGYYMSWLWITRAVNLLLILPTVLSYFAPSRDPDVSQATFLARSLAFDRIVTSISFFTDATANLLVSITPTSSQPLFILFTSLNSLTSGGNPALHSLGAGTLIAIGKGAEVGLVFGAMGLINAVAHVVAPGIYAAIYGATVATFPKAIFAMSSVLLYTAVVMLLLIRPHVEAIKTVEDGSNDPTDLNEEETSALGVENAFAPSGSGSGQNLASPSVHGKNSLGRKSLSLYSHSRDVSLSPYRDRGGERLNSPSIVVDDQSDAEVESPLSPNSGNTGGGVRRERSRGTGRGRRRRRRESELEGLSLHGQEGEDAEIVADRRRSSMIRLSMGEEMQAGV